MHLQQLLPPQYEVIFILVTASEPQRHEVQVSDGQLPPQVSEFIWMTTIKD